MITVDLHQIAECCKRAGFEVQMPQPYIVTIDYAYTGKPCFEFHLDDEKMAAIGLTSNDADRITGEVYNKVLREIVTVVAMR